MTRRSISAKERVRLFLLHKGECHLCHGKITPGEAWDVSHEIPLALGGADDDENRLLAHRKCHRARTSEVDVPQIAKMKRQRVRHIGAKAPSSRPFKGWKKFDGTPVRNPRA